MRMFLYSVYVYIFSKQLSFHFPNKILHHSASRLIINFDRYLPLTQVDKTILRVIKTFHKFRAISFT